MVHLWRGFHHPGLSQLLASSWEKKELVILVPHHLKDFSFLKKIDAKNITYHGEWSDEIKHQNSQILGQEIHPELESVALGVFTSGTSTGVNRLVFYTQANVMAGLSSIRTLFDTKRIRKIFCYPQPMHTFGLLLGYMQASLNGVEIHFSQGTYSRAAHAEWLKVVDEMTLTLGAPTHFMDLIQYLSSQNLKAPKSYSAIVGGARVTVGLWKQMRDTLHIEAPSVGYGATEASPGVTHLPPGVMPSEDGDIGYALKNVEVQVSEKGLEFSGPNVCHLIFENQAFQKPKHILLRDATLTTTTAQGLRYTYFGRTDSIINRGGIKVSLEHVESVVSEKMKVRCLAVSLYEPRLGDELGLIIQTEGAATMTKSQVQEVVKNEWNFQIPESSIIFAQVPLNANGKGDRTAGVIALLKQQKWKFPISIDYLRFMLPHRAPAIWIDSIIDVKPRQGHAVVKLNKSRNYYGLEDSQAVLNEVACVEWAAQTYGYTTAFSDIIGIQKAAVASRTYIAEVKSAEFYLDNFKTTFSESDQIDVRVQCLHDFGNLKVVEGQVHHQEKLLAIINMKLYCG